MYIFCYTQVIRVLQFREATPVGSSIYSVRTSQTNLTLLIGNVQIHCNCAECSDWLGWLLGCQLLLTSDNELAESSSAGAERLTRALKAGATKTV